ncbi:hypothetical protein P170DRAFT_460570 [Aspergillus steynii IBT 23096]|uniref:Nuclear envelope protein n=1 Tax=Aspergillus steynii IBT 23096 TaxID=1392250 RepID=A0A2I2GNJ4_9EURO|nr:uncharacterized protein P170DRAFT_460570 [Aspergillus steynii IBT 23096]PLB54429.1 hypothetical protein P170DRAFT_460570 [Aspergillus steynii IBT 23096]
MAAGPRPYRRILTSALHRRFVHASALALLVNYVIAFLIGDKSSFLWSWFPIGACGIRTVLLFVSSLVVFVLRVGQMHIGSRTTTSPLFTLQDSLPFKVVQTSAWYLFSAWWFSEIYKWSSPRSAHLEWANQARPHERVSLNERPIYLYTCHFVLAIVQSVVHFYYDFDHVPIPVAKPAAGASDQRRHPVASVSKQIHLALPRIASDAFKRAAKVAAASPFLYLIFFRRTAWRFTMSFAKLFWNFPQSAADPPALASFGFWHIFRPLFSGTLLVVCWETANLFFSVFLSKEPLKRGQPLTADAKDPNGSLLTGLNAKKETVRAFAFWELSFISQQFPDRRKGIFNDIDREGAPAWTQILQSASDVIKGISTRIEEKKKPQPGSKLSQPEQPPPVLQTLPRLADPPKEIDIYAPSPKAATRRQHFEEALSSAAKSYGQSPPDWPDWSPRSRVRARDAINRASTSYRELKIITGISTGKPANVQPFVALFLRSPVGWLFRQTYARRLSAVVLGAPYSTACTIVDAIDSLTRLLIASLQEDQYGKVQADVPGVVRLFTDTILTLDPFVNNGMDVHWTDVYFPSESNPQAQLEARKVPEVDLVRDTLKSSLTDLLSAFNPYLKDIGLVGKDLRLAKEAAGIVEDEIAKFNKQ